MPRERGAQRSRPTLQTARASGLAHKTPPNCIAAFIALLAILAGIGGVALPAADGVPRGGRVGWGRLVTESSTWSVHGGNDTSLADFIRTETSLNIDPACYSVEVKSVDDLCTYPFIFTNNLTNVRNPKYLANLREYLHRGIAARQFQRCFVLAEGMRVTGAELRNGLLSIDLDRPEPERLVRKINISVKD